jgi:hypothetical protein
MAARISRHSENYSRSKSNGEGGIFKYLSRGLTNDARRLREIKSRTAMSKQCQQIGLKLKEKK